MFFVKTIAELKESGKPNNFFFKNNSDVQKKKENGQLYGK